MSKRTELIAREVVRDPDGNSLVTGFCSRCGAITVALFDRRKRLCAAFELDGDEARKIAMTLLEQAAEKEGVH